MPTWARLVIAAAALRLFVGLAFYLGGIYNPGLDAPLPAAAYAAMVVSFGGLGLLLVAAAGKDVRAAWLGGVLLLLAVPPTSRFLSQTAFESGTFLTRLQAGAFLPAFLWRFVGEFPSPLAPPAATAARILAAVATSFGLAAFAVNLSIGIWPSSSAELAWRSWLATGQASPSVYWPVLFLISASAAVALVFRMFKSRGADRTRVRIFAGGLALGFLPLFVEISIEELWPSYAAYVQRPGVEPWVAAAVFGPLALVPFVTTYSVVYDRVVDTRLVIHAAIQHALARYTILAATAVPLVALGFYLLEYRASPLTTLLSGPRPLLLVMTVAVGVASLRSRKRILHALDRRFFREVYDAHLLVTALVSDDLIAGTPAAIAGRLRSEIDRTLHATADLYVLDEQGVCFRDPAGALPPLDARGVLSSLTTADTQPMDVQVSGTSPLARLPEAERSWIEQGRYELVLALRSREGAASGLLALTRKRSDLPFSVLDRQCIGALAVPLGLAIENDRLRRSPETPTLPARECLACSRLHAPGTPRCECGSPLADAAVPHVLRGVFQFEQRIGTGGMGVVYRATDLSLKREVAIKTLPRLTQGLAEQLKREAQAMAAINHPNLAVIYGIESWRGTPFLIEEYLAGGTLADRLRRGPMPVAEALEIGSTLAAVLGHLHAAGIVHCDVKASNIGFSQYGVVKLLDFGVAYLLRDAASVTRTSSEFGEDLRDDNDVATHGPVVGTPAYMSPEAAGGAAPAPGFDLWALGVVLFEAIAGQRPFAGRTSNEVRISASRGERADLLALRPDCPAEVAGLFECLLSPDSARRPKRAADLRAQLLALQSAIL